MARLRYGEKGIGMRYGAFLPTRPEYLEAVEELEEAGFSAVWFPDFQLVGADPFLTMAMVGKRLRRAEMGVAVCNPRTRHPMVVANMMATLNRFFPGRLALGVGAGASPLRAIGLSPASAEEVREFVQSCRQLLEPPGRGGPTSRSRLRFLDISSTALNTKDRIPIRVAAGGPKSLRMAGAVADEVILGTIQPELVEAAIRHIRDGAREAGRDPDEVGIAVLAAIYAGDAFGEFDVVATHVGGYVPNMLISNYRLAAEVRERLQPALVAAFDGARAAMIARSSTADTSDYERYMESVPAAYRDVVTMESIRAKAFVDGYERFRADCEQLGALGVGMVVLFADPLDGRALVRVGREWLRAC